MGKRACWNRKREAEKGAKKADQPLRIKRGVRLLPEERADQPLRNESAVVPWPRKMAALMVTAVLLCLLVCGCGGGGGGPFADRPASDLSGYPSMEGYDGEVRLRDTDAAEVAGLMQGGETFVVFAGYEDCAYCNRLLPYLNEAAAGAGRIVGYIDTRSDPKWMNNNDIDDFDKFLDCFGEYLPVEKNGEPHLYTPDTYFVKEGRVVYRHEGLLEGAIDPNLPLTQDQEEELREELAEGFAALQ